MNDQSSQNNFINMDGQSPSNDSDIPPVQNNINTHSYSPNIHSPSCLINCSINCQTDNIPQVIQQNHENDELKEQENTSFQEFLLSQHDEKNQKLEYTNLTDQSEINMRDQQSLVDLNFQFLNYDMYDLDSTFNNQNQNQSDLNSVDLYDYKLIEKDGYGDQSQQEFSQQTLYQQLKSEDYSKKDYQKKQQLQNKLQSQSQIQTCNSIQNQKKEKLNQKNNLNQSLDQDKSQECNGQKNDKKRKKKITSLLGRRASTKASEELRELEKKIKLNAWRNAELEDQTYLINRQKQGLDNENKQCDLEDKKIQQAFKSQKEIQQCNGEKNDKNLKKKTTSLQGRPAKASKGLRELDWKIKLVAWQETELEQQIYLINRQKQGLDNNKLCDLDDKTYYNKAYQQIQQVFKSQKADKEFESMQNQFINFNHELKDPLCGDYVFLGDRFFIDKLIQNEQINNDINIEGVKKKDENTMDIQSLLIIYAFQLFLKTNIDCFISILKMLQIVYNVCEDENKNISIYQTLSPDIIIPKIQHLLEEKERIDLIILYGLLYNVMVESFNHFNSKKEIILRKFDNI